MAKRTIAEINEQIKKLNEEKKEVVKKWSMDMGKLFMEAFPEVPQSKTRAKAFLADLRELADRHIDELAAINRGRTFTNPATTVATPQIENQEREEENNEEPREFEQSDRTES